MNNKINSEIKNLFPDDCTVAALQIKPYLQWAAAYPEEYERVLAMPPIQRGFVWKPKQIQELWDSLLRGMPIGSIMLKASKPNEESGEIVLGKRIVQKNPKSGFHLMDGQQRTLSMLLGFPYSSKEAPYKLWVDFSESGKNGSQFQFRVTTAAQPFGYDNDGSRLSLHYRREARKNWDGEDESKKEKTNREIFDDETTKPWKAGGKQQEYLFEVKNLWQGLGLDPTDSVLPVDRWIVFQAFMQNEVELDKATHVRIMKFRDALMQLENQWIALIKIPDVKVQADLKDPSHDYLTMLFDRISSGGTRLSPDELLFSMIKQSWSDAHNIVYRLQEQVGSLMKPTDFVMTAFRLAMLQSNDSKDPELNAKIFHKHLAGLLGNDDTSVLRKMISEGGTLVTAFKELIEIIEYCDDNDAGIPKLMFPYLNESMLQVILYWLVRNQNDNIQESRDEIIRFILFWFVCHQGAKSAYTASKTAIEIISKTTGGFPSKQIYQELTKKDDNGVSLFHPLIDLSNNLLDSSVFHTPFDREKKFFGEQHVVLYRNFTSRIGLLLWLQRKWIKQAFKDFIPLAGQDEDNVPYDLDHLVPQSNWSSLNGLNREDMTQENRKIFENLYYRRMLGNSIGNYRVLSSSVNRSRGDEPLGSELVDLKIKWDDYALKSNDEIEFQKWKQASPISKDDGFKWNDERLLAFQYAVESRVLYLYKRYFDEMKFGNWL